MLSVFCAVLAALGTSSLSAAEVYRLEKEIPIGGEGGWDCLTVDSPAHRLYVSHATKYVVIDLEKDVVAGEITDTPGAHDFAIAPDLKRGFTSNGKENKSSVVDLATLKTLSKVETGANPDIIIYESSRKEIWCFNASASSITVIEAASGQVAATVPLPGRPEFAEADPSAGKIYCNLEDKNAVAVIDVKTHTVETTWPIAPGQSASGLAIDLAHHRLFLGCDNRLMILMDSTNGQVLGSVPISEHIDGTAFDPGSQLAFASGGDGITTIVHEDAPDRISVVQSLKTEPGARTIAVDPATHRLYTVAAKTEATKTPASEHHWPRVLSGTQKVLVYQPVK